MIFASDNWAGASDEIVGALAAAARHGGPAYGADALTESVERRFAEIFEHDVAVFFVATGTAANALALASFARPGGFALCHRGAHVIADEPGSAALFGDGLRLVGLDGHAGKISVDGLEATLADLAATRPHFGDPVAVSVSQITELGTAYGVEELAAIADLARRSGLGVHMDGARFAGAVAGLSATPADLTWRAGVDILSFGGTKNGCIAADAVVLFDRAKAEPLKAARQRAGHTFSKSWFVAAQFAAYFEGDRWLDQAHHANAAAARLAATIRAHPFARLAFAPAANEVFAVWPKALDVRLRQAGAVYHPWPVDELSPQDRPGQDEVLVRLVTSFATTDAEIDRFVALLRAA